jgi:hypothetical protein
MAVNFKIVEDNTAPDYVITCTRDGTAINLSAATSVVLIIQRKSDGVITQSGKAAAVTTPASGVITYTADTADFPSAGVYVADIKVTYSGGGIEILYNQAKFKVRSKIQ